MSVVGSIGVIAVHQEFSKQLAAAGVTVKVLRAGKYKALATPVEPLSSAAEAQMQARLDAVYQVFVEHVAESRGVTFAQADKMAQGREFFGREALDAGLVDGITTLGAVIGGLQKKMPAA
jgi:ClpP class serine protease